MPGASEYRPRLRRSWLTTLPTMQLSLREIEVLRLIGEGNANKQIADKLSIGETTVKNHISTFFPS